MMRTRTEQMWWCPPQGTTSSELPVVCSWLPRLSEQSYKASSICLNDPSPRAGISSIHPSIQAFFRPQLLQGGESWKQESFQMDSKGWHCYSAWPRRNVQSTSLACRQLETQKWRDGNFWLLGETSKGLWKDERGPLLLIPVASLKSCSIFPQRNARTKPKTHRKKQPTVMVCMDTINAKAFKQGCAHLSPVKLMASLPRISKDLGSKHCVFDSQSWECWGVSALNPALRDSILIATSAVWWSTSSNSITQVPPAH